MYIQFCFAVFISAAAFAASETNGGGLNIVAIAKAGVRVEGGRRNQIDERRKRATSDSDRDTILNAFNCQRSLLGASDITYLSWSSVLESDVNNYIQNCDSDAKFMSTTGNSFILRSVVSSNDGHKSTVDSFFTDAEFKNDVTSKYLLQVGGGYKYCSTLTEDGKTRSNVYFYAYGISATSNFNSTAPQYTSGNACTRCEAGVNWCYSKLCRGDCSSSTSGCCSITNNIPAQCGSSNLICGSSSSIIEVKTSVMMLAIVSALRSCVL